MITPALALRTNRYVTTLALVLWYAGAMKPKPNADPIASALAAKRRIAERQCIVCGATFQGLSTKQTCSPRCRATLFRQRHPRARADGEQTASTGEAAPPAR